MWIDVEDAAGNRLGEGPITNVLAWESKAMLSQAGSFACDVPLTAANQALAQHYRRVICRDVIGGATVTVGAGIIHKLSTSAAGVLHIEGPDLLYELTHCHVGALAIDDGAGAATVDGPELVMDYAPEGWSLGGHTTTLKAILHRFEGETVLAALVKIADLTGERFRLGVGRTVVWMQVDQPEAGVLLTNLGDPLASEGDSDIAIAGMGLKLLEDSYECGIGRLYAQGQGIGNARINLQGAACSYTGYTLGSDSRGYYLEHTATWSANGIERYKSFKDINSAQTLLEQAYEYLRAQLTPPVAVEIPVARLNRIVPVGYRLHAQCREVIDGGVVIDLDDDLTVLSTVTRYDGMGARLTAITVASVARLPKSEAGALVAMLSTAQQFWTHPQTTSGEVHAGSHENGGGDEINVGGLSGVLADAQPPAAHQHAYTDLSDGAPVRWRGSSATPPGTPRDGDLWHDTSGGGNAVKLYANGGWVGT